MKINYSESGVKTLRGASVLFLLSSIVSSLMLIPQWQTKTEGYSFVTHTNWGMIALSSMIFIAGIFTYAVGLAIATIAENSLYQKQKSELTDTNE